jgi:dihydropteroate synthase
LPSGTLPLDRVAVMGILNRTPDSFYSAARFSGRDQAVERALQMIEEGANLIDIGGEKAGPGVPVPIDEEIARVVPTIEAVRRATGVPISVDTFKPEVARAAVDAGADIINSIGGFQDAAMRHVAAATRAAVVIMHIKGEPRVANPHPSYEDVVDEVREFLLARVRECLEDGITEDRIVIDPGPGFGKTAEHDLAVVRDIARLSELPYPVLLAVSRKAFIGQVLDLPVDERLEGSLAATVWGVLRGVRIVRTHDVKATARVCRMVEAVYRPELVQE